MIFVPLSFCATLLLLVLIVRLLSARDEGGPAWPFILLLLLYTVQTVMVGLRWGYGVTEILPLLATIASAIPPASYLAFRGLAQEGDMVRSGDWPHVLPVIAVVILFALWRAPIDILIIADFLGYGAALFWLARHGPDGLVASRLDGALRSWRSMLAGGVMLVSSALTDCAVSLDMSLGGGRHAGEVVSVSTTLILLLLGIAAASAGSGGGRREVEEGQASRKAVGAAAENDNPDTATASGADAQIAADLDRLMGERQLFADADLNLARLARRLGLPARAVSNAVNRVHGVSVSQYVNNLRVVEACRLLAESDLPVTAIFYEAGFMTKSNFNREFLRVTGKSPTVWRADAAARRQAG
ncbi:helix-turn-helix domain-containing protein [Agrobacterium sp. ES01]|uniref:helix-turn-helix domain-containing protein n=1 Tax=Agrobacterium sp. ES01 TaxID=3420714 RepID=UPI003D1093C1